MIPIIKNIGLIDYHCCWLKMKDFVANRQVLDNDQIWLLQHQDVFTMGANASYDDIISNDNNIPIVQTDRGGKVTFHGLGQIIVYLLLDINRLQLNVRSLVQKLEFAIINCLKKLGINSYLSLNNPGIYIDQDYNIKIASIGLKINKQGYCYHGISVNFAVNKKPFNDINICGQVGMQIVNIIDLKPDLIIADVEQLLINNIVESLYNNTN